MDYGHKVGDILTIPRKGYVIKARVDGYNTYELPANICRLRVLKIQDERYITNDSTSVICKYGEVVYAGDDVLSMDGEIFGKHTVDAIKDLCK